MAREFAKAFYNSKEWKRCRASFIAYRQSIDGGLCQTCRENLGYIVHHNKEWLTEENINDPEVALSFDNLKYDCLICHNKEKEGEESSNYYLGTDGQIYPIPP
jgi:hypothetical protein